MGGTSVISKPRRSKRRSPLHEASLSCISLINIVVLFAGICSRPPISGPYWTRFTQIKRLTVPSCVAAQRAAVEWDKEFWAWWDEQLLSGHMGNSMRWWLDTHPEEDRFRLLPPSWATPSCIRVYGPRLRDGHKQLWDVSYLGTQRQEGSRACIIYSVGGNAQVEFEEAMLKHTSCDIWSFDCTIEESKMAQVVQASGISEGDRGRMHFKQSCMGKDGLLQKLAFEGRQISSVLRSMRTLQGWLGHLDSGMDILKFDAEGAEHEVFKDWLQEQGVAGNASALPSQIVLEVHLRKGFLETLRDLQVFRLLFKAGYILVSQEQNPLGKFCCSEFTFVLGCSAWQARQDSCDRETV